MRKIVCLQPLSPRHLERISAALPPDWELIHGKPEQIAEQLGSAEIVIGWSRKTVTQALQPGSPLRWIQNWGAGVDRIPLAELAARGVVVTNARGVHPYPISETILGMMLAFSRKLHIAVRHQVQATWKPVGEMGEIHGRTMGILGVGAIGEETARLGRAFGMKVLGLRRSGEPSSYVDRMFASDGLGELLRESDYVISTLPLTDATRHYMGRNEFAQMKVSAIYINIGRGATTDTEALIQALQEGRIGGAGLDVFEQEPLPESSPLWQMENVILTPHNAGGTIHYDDRALDIFLTNLQAFLLHGQPSTNLVDVKRQY